MNKSIVYILFLFLFFVGIRLFIPFNGLYGQDGFEYLRYAERLRSWMVTGRPPGDFFWPVGFPLYGALLSFIFQDMAFSLQLLSFAGSLMCFYYSYKIANTLYAGNKNAKLYFFLFLSLQPFILRSSVVVMSDIACAGFITGAFYYALRYADSSRLKHVLLLAFFAANAIMFRYAAFVLICPVILWTAYKMVRKGKALQMILPLLLTFIIFFPHYFIRGQNSIAFLNHGGLVTWSIKNFFSRDFTNQDGNYHYRLPNCLYYVFEPFHAGYFLPGVLFAYWSFKGRKYVPFEKLIVISVLLYLLFLMGIRLQNPRFILPVVPAIVLFFYPGFERLFAKINSYKVYMIVGVATTQLTLFFISSNVFFERNKLEREIVGYLEKETSQPVLYSFDIDISLQGYGLKKEFNNLWEKKYDSFQQHALVLFNPDGFKEQWKNKNPMINWDNLNREYQLKLIKTFDKGWKLYEIN